MSKSAGLRLRRVTDVQHMLAPRPAERWKDLSTVAGQLGQLTYRKHERMSAWTVPKLVTSLELDEVENCTSTSWTGVALRATRKQIASQRLCADCGCILCGWTLLMSVDLCVCRLTKLEHKFWKIWRVWSKNIEKTTHWNLDFTQRLKDSHYIKLQRRSFPRCHLEAWLVSRAPRGWDMSSIVPQWCKLIQIQRVIHDLYDSSRLINTRYHLHIIFMFHSSMMFEHVFLIRFTPVSHSGWGNMAGPATAEKDCSLLEMLTSQEQVGIRQHMATMVTDWHSLTYGPYG